MMDTETTALTNYEAAKQKINGLLALKKITIKDIEGLSRMERELLAETATQILPKLTGAERDNFLDKIDLIILPATKSNAWEYNHFVITEAIAGFMRLHGIMPTRNAIADETGLSRQTVAKHFAAYKAQPEFAAQMEQFKFMAPKMLANVFKYASAGDMRAARLYFEMIGSVNKKQNTVVNEQNNYIQVNNTILSQENLKQLTPKQLSQIERIITRNANKKTARLKEQADNIIRI